MIFDMLGNRMHKHCVTRDIRKAFHQIKIGPEDRDAMDLLWFDNLEDRNIISYRFTGVIFGSAPSPYILGSMLQKHISQYVEQYSETVVDLLKNIYVDDIQSGGDDIEKLYKFKAEATEIMKEGVFRLCKWHRHISKIEESGDSTCKGLTAEESSAYAKLTEGTRPHKTKILGTIWNKDNDPLSINLTKCTEQNDDGPLTKQKMLSAIHGIHVVLGIVAPVVIVGKILYSQVYLKDLKWDKEVPEEIKGTWNRWLKAIHKESSVSVPRSVVDNGVMRLVLHGSSDASDLAVCSVIFVVVYHDALPVKQNLLVAKLRIAPRNTSIPRKELVAAHMLS